MPDDKRVKNIKPQDTPVNNVVPDPKSSTSVGDPIVADGELQDSSNKVSPQQAQQVDEQASLDELAEKLAKWKSTMSQEQSTGTNQVSDVGTSPNLKEATSQGSLKDQSTDLKTSPTLRGQMTNQDLDETIEGGVSNKNISEKRSILEDGVKNTSTKDVQDNAIKQQPVKENKTPVPAGISVTPGDVKPKVDDKAVVRQFEREVQEAAVVKAVSYPKNIRKLLELANERGSSDLHVTVGYPPVFRIDGKLVHIGTELVTPEMAEKLIFPVLAESKRDLLEVNREVDVAYEIESLARFRVNVYHEKGRLAAAFRLIPERIKTIEELNLPKILRRFTKLSQGFVLITGPTGHGKTTTLASLLQEINKAYEKHIITIEDPIEYVYPRAKALITQREMHEDTHSWEIALRSAMREDPDVVLVGEMRDHETISSAITLAETGHLVFATLHTNSASQTIDRIIDSFPDNQQSQVRGQLASIIEGVVCQRLIPVRTGGRRPACEIMLSTSAVKNLIREGKTYQIDNVIRTSLDVGMTSMENSLVQLVREGLISVEQAEEYATDPEEVIRLLR